MFKLYGLFFSLLLLILFGMAGVEGRFSAHAEKSGVESVEPKNGIKLSAARVVNYLLGNNYDVKQALLDYKKTSSNLRRYQGKYDYLLHAGGNYSATESSSDANPRASSKRYSNLSGKVGVSKKFSSGTTLSGEFNSSMPSYEEMKQTGKDLDLYQTGFSIQLSQELMKNSFGVNDRREEQKLFNRKLAERNNIRRRLAGLIVDALIAYWNIAVAEENLTTRKISLNSTANIRSVLRKKIPLGLAEREEVSHWSYKVLDAKNNMDRAEKFLFDSKLAMRRVLNLSSQAKLLMGKTFRKNSPAISLQTALKDAFLNRSELQNKRLELKNVGLDYEIAQNRSLPSLIVKGAYGSTSYDTENLGNTLGEHNPEYSLGFEFTYPLNGRTSEANLRDARIAKRYLVLDLKKVETEIRDDVISKVKQCEVDYNIYVRAKKARSYARNYYNLVYKKFKRGRYSTLELKMALDSYIQSRQVALKSLVDYNISLLRRDLARNVVFKNYGIDIDSVLKSVEEF